MPTEPIYQVANQWHPVTEQYQDVEIPTLETVPLQQTNLYIELNPKRKEQSRAKRLPFMIAAYAWYCFLRGAVFLMLAFFLFSFPDTEWGIWLGDHATNSIRHAIEAGSGLAGSMQSRSALDREDRADAEARRRNAVPLVLFMVAAWYFGIGWKWLQRSNRARWVAMMTALAALCSVGTDWFAGKVSGYEPPGARTGSLIAFTLNLTVLLYLAFYPGVKQAFEDSETE
jgi:hypothetical protein